MPQSETGDITASPVPDHGSLEPYTLPPSTFLDAHPHIGRILSSSVIFHPCPPSHSSGPLTLLLRRSPTDWHPLRWETPGGSVDLGSDHSILFAAVRELREETGLRAKRAVCCVAPRGEEQEQEEEEEEEEGESAVEGGYVVEDDGQVWTFPEPGQDWRWGKVTFLMEVEAGEVTLQAEEHVDYRWVTEDEVLQKKFNGGREEEKIEFVSEMVRQAVLEAFKIKREMLAMER